MMTFTEMSQVSYNNLSNPDLNNNWVLLSWAIFHHPSPTATVPWLCHYQAPAHPSTLPRHSPQTLQPSARGSLVASSFFQTITLNWERWWCLSVDTNNDRNYPCKNYWRVKIFRRTKIELDPQSREEREWGRGEWGGDGGSWRGKV